MKKVYEFKAEIQVYSGSAAWHYLILPKDVAENIEFYFHHVKRGWGSLPVMVTLGETTWKTSIFTDKKTASFMLPLKTEVRKKENVAERDTVSVTLVVDE